jgi:hypothetical protein
MEAYCVYILCGLALIAFLSWATGTSKTCITPRWFCQRCTRFSHCVRWAKTIKARR